MTSSAHTSTSNKRKQHSTTLSSSSNRLSTDAQEGRSYSRANSTSKDSSNSDGVQMDQSVSRQPTLFEAGFSRQQPARLSGDEKQADDIEDDDEQDSKQSDSAAHNDTAAAAANGWTDKKRRTVAVRDRNDRAQSTHLSSTPPSHSTPAIVHSPSTHRFESGTGSDVAFLEYTEQRRGSRIVWDVWHTSVPVPLRKRGLAMRLCMAAFAAARSERIGVIPSCTYVSNKFLVEHPEQRDIVISADGTANGRAGKQQQQQAASATPRKMNGADRRMEQKDTYSRSHNNATRASPSTHSTTRTDHTTTSSRSSPLSPAAHSPPSLALDWYRHVSLLLPAGSALATHHCPLPHHPILGRSHFPRVLADIRRYQSAAPTAASVVLLFASLLSRPNEDETSYIRDGLHFLLHHVMSTAERQDFLEHSLPYALQHIHDLPVTFPTAALPLLVASPAGSQSVHYSKHELAAILSCSLFSMHAEHRGSGHLRFPSANFKELLIATGRVARVHDRAVKRGERDWQRSGRAHNNDIEKLRCMLHYLWVVASRAQHELQHTIVTFHRRSINETADVLLATALMSSAPIPAFTPFAPPHTIEDDLVASHSLHLDFANKYIGGGVLGHGCVQEEILFSIAAECLASLLFCERMDVNEAIVIVGAERFCRYRGYGSSFEFAGAWEGKEQYEVVREERGRRRGRRVIVAIDAIPFSRKLLQWHDHAIARELLKAFVGFSVPLDAIASVSSPASPAVSELYPSLSTGNWGSANHTQGSKSNRSRVTATVDADSALLFAVVCIRLWCVRWRCAAEGCHPAGSGRPEWPCHPLLHIRRPALRRPGRLRATHAPPAHDSGRGDEAHHRVRTMQAAEGHTAGEQPTRLPQQTATRQRWQPHTKRQEWRRTHETFAERQPGRSSGSGQWRARGQGRRRHGGSGGGRRVGRTKQLGEFGYGVGRGPGCGLGNEGAVEGRR